MSTEPILTRMMNEPEFAEAVFANPEKALAEYNLTAEGLAVFKGLTRAQFEEMSSDDRKSFGLPYNHNESIS